MKGKISRSLGRRDTIIRGRREMSENGEEAMMRSKSIRGIEEGHSHR
jgi:hypothetical protein